MRSLLLGWGNATPGQLAAYERLHRALGLEPRTVIASTAAGLLGRTAYVASVVPTVERMQGGERVDLVHVFSDNGFIAWASLLDLLVATPEGRRARDAIRGVVLDSSPGLWAATGKLDFARRFAGAMTPLVARAARRPPRAHLPVVTPALTALFVAYQLALPRAAAAMKGAADRVLAEQPAVPHLFLYGREDTLVPARDVEAWIARQRRHGVDVEARSFGRARHVALYPADPRRYRAELAAFVERVRG